MVFFKDEHDYFDCLRERERERGMKKNMKLHEDKRLCKIYKSLYEAS